jgi:hypothetical protein
MAAIRCLSSSVALCFCLTFLTARAAEVVTVPPKPSAGTAAKPSERERAIALALEWLARHQDRDNGSWSLKGLAKQCKDGDQCNGPGEYDADSAATAMGLLPFLAAGQTQKAKGPYQRTVADGLKWLSRHQKADGDLRCGSSMYAHGLASISLCEAYAQTTDKHVGRAAQAAVNFILEAQNRDTGGWRYQPGDPGDTSVLGWQLAALARAKAAGLTVSDESLKRAARWLDACAKGAANSQYSYTPEGGPSITMTAVGLLCRQRLGAKPESDMLFEGTKYLMQNLPEAKLPNVYYCYYATQVMHNLPGKERDAWNRSVSKVLIKAQCTDATSCAAGSWDPRKDQWGRMGGRLMITSFSTLCLLVQGGELTALQPQSIKLEKGPTDGTKRTGDKSDAPSPAKSNDANSAPNFGTREADGHDSKNSAQSFGKTLERPGSVPTKGDRCADETLLPLSSIGNLRERAIEGALRWLMRHQSPDGSWSLDHFDRNCTDKTCTGAGATQADAGATALALLPFFRAGLMRGAQAPYHQTVNKGVACLRHHQKPDGNLAAGDRPPMYSHALATIVLCEAYRFTRDVRSGESAQKAVNFIESAQNTTTGGWRYNPGDPGDTSVLGWQVSALASARMVGLRVHAATGKRAAKWLDSVAHAPSAGHFSYMPEASPSNTMTAVGLLCRQYMGVKGDSPAMVEGRKYLMASLPDAKSPNVYYWYFATQTLDNMPDSQWDLWSRTLWRLMVSCQAKHGCAQGSWAPEKDAWGRQGGRIMITSLATLSIIPTYAGMPLPKAGMSLLIEEPEKPKRPKRIDDE